MKILFELCSVALVYIINKTITFSSRQRYSIMANYKLAFSLFINLILGILIIYLYTPNRLSHQFLNCLSSTTSRRECSLNTSMNVQMINLKQSIDTQFHCIKTKTLLHYISTTVCLHETAKDIFVSGSFRNNTSIWEEEGVTRILKLLIRHPHLDFIDVGANIGTYTMYVAALGRFVLAIDCFAPNINRLHRAIQLADVANRVVVIQNALYSHSGEFLRLSNDLRNIGGQELKISTNQSLINDSYTVKTIEFDDLFPILVSRGIRGAIMKIDIEGSESFVVERGSQIFDSFEIPFIQMEWMKVSQYPERVKIIIDFFTKRKYNPMTFSCQLLNSAQYSTWPGDMCWIKRNVSSFC